MPVCDSIIAVNATVNAATAQLVAVAPTSLTIRDSAYGRAMVTHAAAFVSTDDVNHVYIVPSGYRDSNGFEVPSIIRYAATSTFKLEDFKLPKPIPLDNNSALVINAQSETAANTVVMAWVVVEYSGRGNYEAIGGGEGYTQRDLDAGAALTSDVAADGTAITTLQANRGYQIAGISGVGVDGQTAGIVGPAFVAFKGPAEFEGMNYYIPLPNSGGYLASGRGEWADLAKAGMKMPKFRAPNTLTPNFIGYTAERPQGRLILNVDKVY